MVRMIAKRAVGIMPSSPLTAREGELRFRPRICLQNFSFGLLTGDSREYLRRASGFFEHIVIVESPEICMHRMAFQFVMVVAVWGIVNGTAGTLNQVTMI